jgi:uncharacterized protein (DUF608 family)
MAVYSRDELYRGKYDYVYDRRHKEALMLLGGIGTGSISLGSRGQFTDFELFNHPSKGLRFPYTFFAVHGQGREVSFTKILESRLTPPYTAANGLPAQELAGLPRFLESEMRVRFPFVCIRFIDERLPIEAAMEAYNPFIPLNADDSGIPAALIRYRIKNTQAEPLEISVAGSLYNASGYAGKEIFGNFINQGKPFNQYREEGGVRGIFFDNDGLDRQSTEYGNLALLTGDDSVSYKAEWQMGQRIDGAHNFWDDFNEDGKLCNEAGHMGIDGKLDKKVLAKIGSLSVTHTLGPNEEKDFSFVLAWYFPNRIKNWPMDQVICDSESMKTVKNYYAVKFKSAWDAGSYLLNNNKRLETLSRKFSDAVYESTLPPYVIDAMTGNLAILKSTTCFRIENGHMFAFEGCLDNTGSCPGNCTHVWYYAQAMAYLFPELEQSMRRTDFLVETNDEGEMQFRAMRELNGASWGFLPSVDGQMGTIVRLYREWLISGDESLLKELWPKAKQALDYGIRIWDTDKDFVLDGMKHVDYDVEFYGVDPLGNLDYLAALKAAIKMADYLEDTDARNKYLNIYNKASVLADKLMWDEKAGYFIQVLKDVDEFKYQHGKGCLADQLIGQFYAYLTGLGPLVKPEHVKKAVSSVFKYNFISDFTDHPNMQRSYAINNDKGLLMTTWPFGGRPKYPFFYSEEAWSRTEYHVAATLIYEGFIDEGLTIVKAIRERYDGIKRNPWNEFECGWHYSGTMSSWGLLPALSGYRPDLPAKKIHFAPLINRENFKCFWSNGKAWGTFSRKMENGKITHNIETLYGDLSGIEAVVD